MSAIQLVVTLTVAALCGLAAQRYSIPGGIFLGTMAGAGAVTLVSDLSLPLPQPLQNGAFIVVGASIGVMLTRESVARLLPVFVPAILSALLLIVAGIGVAYLLRLFGIAPPGDVLATSPGALTVVAAMALEQGVGAVEVAVFHLVRLIAVMVTLPLVAQLLHTTPG